MKKRFNKHKKLMFCFGIIIGVVILLFLGFLVYVGDYYEADRKRINSFNKNSNIVMKELDDIIVFGSESNSIGFIFYPGGKVDYRAYEPLMQQLATKNVTSILVDMPFNLAIFGLNRADDIIKNYPNIKSWYIGGHSLGGAMAATYVSSNLDKFDGLILLGAYSTSDLSKSSLNVISIYGSEDNILNIDKYNSNKKMLPSNYSELIIKGGNHSYFGFYGMQDGDGKATISNIEQIKQTVNFIEECLK